MFVTTRMIRLSSSSWHHHHDGEDLGRLRAARSARRPLARP